MTAPEHGLYTVSPKIAYRSGSSGERPVGRLPADEQGHLRRRPRIRIRRAHAIAQGRGRHTFAGCVQARFSGIEVLRRLARVMPLPPTILLTTFDDDEALLQGIRAGAKGYLLKDVSIDQLADSIRRVVASETRIRPAITERATRVLQGADSSLDRFDLPDALTKREAEILRMTAGGFSNRKIGEALGCSEGTIKNHASSILSKLGVRDRTRAVLRGIELGMI